MAAAAAIALRAVAKEYRLGRALVRALVAVDLEIANGDLVAVTGPSGSGKSTLLGIMGALDVPTRGECLIDGVATAGLDGAGLAALRNRTLGFVFQGFHLMPRATARENVALPLLYAGVARGERLARAEQALARVGMAGRADHRPSELSGGQRQRVAIARALVTRPRVILADEPTGNLDSRSSASVMALLHSLWRDGATVVVVTHEPDVAAYARRVLTVRDGAIVSDRVQDPAAPPALVEEAA